MNLQNYKKLSFRLSSRHVINQNMQALPFDQIAPHYDALNDVLSLGLHRRWKRKVVRTLLAAYEKSPECIADIATGTGDIALQFCEQLEGPCQVIGIDPSEQMLALARQATGPALQWRQGASEQLPLGSNSVDILACGFGVRNFQDRAKAFAEWKRVMKPGAVGGILEIHPLSSRFARTPLSFYWRQVVPRLGQLVGHREAYAYLRDSALRFVTATEMQEELKNAGLTPISSKSFFACGMVSFSLFQNDEAGPEQAE